MAFVTVQQLRDDWYDNPDLTDAQRTALDRLSDEQLEEALEAATDKRDWELYWALFDGIRAAATDRLVRALRESHKTGGGAS